MDVKRIAMQNVLFLPWNELIRMFIGTATSGIGLYHWSQKVGKKRFGCLAIIDS